MSFHPLSMIANLNSSLSAYKAYQFHNMFSPTNTLKLKGSLWIKVCKYEHSSIFSIIISIISIHWLEFFSFFPLFSELFSAIVFDSAAMFLKHFRTRFSSWFRLFRPSSRSFRNFLCSWKNNKSHCYRKAG